MRFQHDYNPAVSSPGPSDRFGSALPEREFTVVAELRRGIERQFRDLIADGVAAGVFHVPDVRIAARAVLSLGIDVARWYSEGVRTTPAELGAQYTGLVLRMLGTATD